jgi:hypothetical protein
MLTPVRDVGVSADPPGSGSALGGEDILVGLSFALVDDAHFPYQPAEKRRKPAPLAAVEGAEESDPGCLDGLDYDENEASLACDDGVDNDADGNADYPDDPGCRNLTTSPENPQCTAAWMNRDAPAASAGGCGVGPELAALLPLLSAPRRTRRCL